MTRRYKSNTPVCNIIDGTSSMSSSSTQRFTLTGIAYPKIQPGDGPADKRVPRSVDTNDKACYDHPALQLCEADMERYRNLRGTPLCDEHAHWKNGNPVGKCSSCVGEILDARVLKDHSVYVVASIHADTPNGARAMERVRRKELRGFSIGLTNLRATKDSPVRGRIIHEVSLTDAPNWASCNIAVTASAGASYKNDADLPVTEELWIPIDATLDMSATAADATTTSAAPAVAAPVATGAATSAPAAAGAPVATESQLAQEAGALARESAERKSSDAELAKRLARLDQLEKAEDARREAAAELKRTEAKKWTAEYRRIAPEAFNEDSERGWLNLATSEDPKVQAQVQAQATVVAKFLAQEQAAKDQAEAMKKLQDEIAKRDSEQKILEAHVRDSRANLRRGDNVPQKAAADVAVTASAGASRGSAQTSHLTDFFTVPVAYQNWEQRLFSEANPNAELRDMASSNVPVTANSEKTAPNGFIEVAPLSSHRFVDRVMNGPRGVVDEHGNHTGAAYMSKWVNDFEAALGSAPTSEKYNFNKQQGYAYKLADGRIHTIGRTSEREARF